MHPQIRQYDPSVCPICGMRLELTPQTLIEGENPERLDVLKDEPLPDDHCGQ